MKSYRRRVRWASWASHPDWEGDSGSAQACSVRESPRQTTVVRPRPGPSAEAICIRGGGGGGGGGRNKEEVVAG